MNDMSRQTEEKRGDQLFRMALKAYGVEKEEHILSWTYCRPQENDGEKIIFVTHGGMKRTYREGDQPEKLSQVQVDGISQKKPRIIDGLGKRKIRG